MPIEVQQVMSGLSRRTAVTSRPLVHGAVIRYFRDFAATEDAVQDALVAAAHQGLNRFESIP